MSLYVKGQSFVLHQIRKMIGEWLPWKQCISGSDPSLVVSIMIESPSPVTSTALMRVDHLLSPSALHTCPTHHSRSSDSCCERVHTRRHYCKSLQERKGAGRELCEMDWL